MYDIQSSLSMVLFLKKSYGSSVLGSKDNTLSCTFVSRGCLVREARQVWLLQSCLCQVTLYHAPGTRWGIYLLKWLKFPATP